MASGDQYVLAGIFGGDGLGTYGNLLPTRTEGESTLDPGRRVVVERCSGQDGGGLGYVTREPEIPPAP